MRCPYRKIHTFLFSVLYQMCTQLLINLVMIALSEKVLIQLAYFIRFLLFFSHNYPSHSVAYL